jgi:hypothetical protein
MYVSLSSMVTFYAGLSLKTFYAGLKKKYKLRPWFFFWSEQKLN